MRLVIMGTGGFAVPALESLYGTDHEIAALFTRPARTAHTRRKEPANPMRAAAEAHGTTIFDPESINSAQSQQQLAELAADLFVVADYGQILKRKTLELARLGGVNIHGSLLPKYRGAAPINWAIYHGDEVTGVTVIHMTPKLDAGPCIAQGELPIGPDETAPQVEARLSDLGARLVVDAIAKLEAGTTQSIPQDTALVSQAPRLTKEDGAVDWTRPAAAIRNQIRAMEPWPRTYTHWLRPDHEPLRLILGPAVELEGESSTINILLRTDTKGAVFAIEKELEKLKQKHIPVHVVDAAAGKITGADVRMAAATDATIIGFNVAVENPAWSTARELEVDVQFYDNIYEITDVLLKRFAAITPPKAGEVIQADHERLVVATGSDPLQLTAVQPAGKRMLPAAEFLNGYPVQPGERFGPA